MLRFLTLLIVIALVVLISIFTLGNLDSVTIHFLTRSLQVPLGVTLLFCLGAGVLVGLLFSAGMVIRNKNRAKSLARKVAMFEQEIANLRQLPIKSPR
ncbi:MAG: LapA family protein [Gammaproteobacteria bacterium]|nr:LapA family protein [Gammaproteobacteria bacterium]